MKNKLTKIFLALILLVFALDGAIAQQTSSILSGKILDEKNLPMPGVNVQITYLPLKKTSATVTNEKGQFYVPNLSPGGPYEVKISFIGYKAETRGIPTLSLGANTEISVQMQTETTEIAGVAQAPVYHKPLGVGRVCMF